MHKKGNLRSICNSNYLSYTEQNIDTSISYPAGNLLPIHLSINGCCYILNAQFKSTESALSSYSKTLYVEWFSIFVGCKSKNKREYNYSGE